MKHGIWLLLCGTALLVVGCGGARRPVLYPNAHFSAVGQQQAEMDIDACMYSAQASGANGGKGGELARNTAKAGAAGGATGAVVGAITSSSNIGRGAAIGGAGAATATLIGGAFEADEPTEIYIRFVDQCLQEKGYQPIGWR